MDERHHIWEKLEPLIEGEGFDLVEVELSGGRGPVLRLFVDCPGRDGLSPEGGISVEDCAQLSRTLGDVLDGEDLMKGSYTLEVSSPGLERPVRKAADFQRFEGRECKIKLKHPVGGKRTHKGTLDGMEGQSVLLRAQEEQVALPLEAITRARLLYDFGAAKAAREKKKQPSKGR